MSQQDPLVIRTSPVTAVIFCIIFSALPIIGIAVITEGNGSPLGGLLFCACYPVAVGYICWRSFTFDGSTLVYKSLMGKSSIDLPAIQSVEVFARPAPML